MWLPKSKCSQDLWSAGDQILAVNEVTDVPFPQWTIKATPCDPHAECRDARGSWGIKDDQRWSKGKRDQWPDDLKSHLMWPDVTWCDLDDAVSLWNLVNTRRGILEEMKNQNMLRFKASRRVPATSQGPGWKNFNALTFALKVVESSSSVYAKVMRLWLLGIVWDCLGLFVFSSLVSLDFAQILRPRSDWKLRRLNQTEHYNFLSFFLSFLYVFLVPHSWVAVPFRV